SYRKWRPQFLPPKMALARERNTFFGLCVAHRSRAKPHESNELDQRDFFPEVSPFWRPDGAARTGKCAHATNCSNGQIAQVTWFLNPQSSIPNLPGQMSPGYS